MLPPTTSADGPSGSPSPINGIPALLSTASPYTILRSTAVGSSPSSVTFDRANGLLYVTNILSDNISVVDAKSLHVVSSIFTGYQATQSALDPGNGRLFVANQYTSNISVLNTKGPPELTAIPTPGYSYPLADEFDAATGQLFVVANNNPDILVFNAETLAFERAIPVDPNPGGNLYAINASSHVIYFPARGSLAVELIGSRNGTTFREIPTPTAYGATSTFQDPSNGFVYVMLGGFLEDPGDHIGILNPATGKFISTLTVGKWPNIYAYDAVRHILYVCCEGSGEVSVINTLSGRVLAEIHLGAATDPHGIAVDPLSGHVFVTEIGTGELVELGQV